MLRIWKSRAIATPVLRARPLSAGRVVLSELDMAGRSERNDTSGALRRIRQTVEDNRLL